MEGNLRLLFSNEKKRQLEPDLNYILLLDKLDILPL